MKITISSLFSPLHTKVIASRSLASLVIIQDIGFGVIQKANLSGPFSEFISLPSPLFPSFSVSLPQESTRPPSVLLHRGVFISQKGRWEEFRHGSIGH